jgi:translation initiation factor 3 subunit G
MYVSADTDHPDPVSGAKICKACRRYYCDRNAVDFPVGNCPRGTLWDPKNRFLTAIPGMLVPSFAWPFVDEMTAKSDDKTLVVSHITREIRKETDFLELFERFGEVSSAKLAPLDPEGTRRGGFGFVTFVNKEDAQKAMDTLNASPLGRDNRTLALDWASTLKKPT